MQSQNSFLLSYLKYGESDAILHVFSKESGYKSFFAHRIYASKSTKKAYLFPLNKINITYLNKNNSSNLSTISALENLPNNYNFDSVKINAVLFFVADFLNQVLREESHFEKIYLEIKIFLESLLTKNYNSYISFIFNILRLQGIAPLISDEVFLNPESGNFSSSQSHPFFTQEISAVWKKYLLSEDIYAVNLKYDIRKKTLESLISYYQIHFESFYPPKSLEIIQQVFE